MTTPQRPPRTCQGYGHRFIPDGDEADCSGICAGTPSLWSLIAAAQQAARLQGRSRP